MSRPYSALTTDQLESEFSRASKAKDLIVLEGLAHELTFRHRNRAQVLSKKVATAVEKLNRLATATTHQSRNPVRPAPRHASFTPTGEQERAIELFKTGGPLKINAYAGAGKTSTLQMLAHSSNNQGQYIAFNKDIVRDASQKFPRSVNCATTHGLAFRATPSALKANMGKMTGKINAHQLAAELNLKKWQIDGRFALEPRSQAFLFLETVKRFAQSADREPALNHVPQLGALLAASKPVLEVVAEVGVRFAKYLWERMCNPADPLPLGHDGYLKLWALGNPKIGADFILLDEAQDTNPVVLGVLADQTAQMIYVGDQYQQIYEWRGAVNAMERIETRHSTLLSTSFRFGAEIASYASRILFLLGEQRPLLGNPSINSRIGGTTPKAILARTNANAMTALIEGLDADRRCHLVGGSTEMMEMLKGVQDLKNGEASSVAEFFGFTSWKEVVDFAKSGEGQHLMTFVNLVETRGEKQLMWAINQCVDESVAEVTISTAHRAKGREWPSVRLMDDFLKSKADPEAAKPLPGTAKGFDAAELRLYYVAVTRAKQVIDIPSTLLQMIA